MSKYNKSEKEEVIQKYETIKYLSAKYSISLLCETLDVPKGSYFNTSSTGNSLIQSS